MAFRFRQGAACAVLCWALCACAPLSGSLNVWPQPLPHAGVVWFHVTQADTGRQSLVAAQADADGRWRWVQTDAFGAPLARQTVGADGWHNDGFLPPNAEASRLFAALAVQAGEAANVPVQRIYPHLQAAEEQGWRVWRAHGTEVWRMRDTARGREIRLADGSLWLSETVNGDAP